MIPRTHKVKRETLAGALAGAASLAAAVLCARPAWACSVCFSIADKARDAYYGTTVLLMLLPFLLIGGILYWLRRAARRQRMLGKQQREGTSAATPGSPGVRRVPPDPDPLH
jgi:hypothetical protein